MSADESEARLGELAARYGLTENQRRQLRLLLTGLQRDERAPTTARTPSVAVDVHIADSLVALGVPELRAADTIADIGTGAGFPGLALAVALRECDMRLLDSHGRTCAFVAELAASAQIERARVVCARVEEWREGEGAQDVVLARALGPQPLVLEYAAPLLRLGGILIDWRGRRVRDEEEAALRAPGELGLQLIARERVLPFEGARDRHLHLFGKAAATPERYPRRAGIARKRPLGG